jgi:putative membrane protein
MLLPGISGSFILLLLNKYSYIFSAIGYFRLSVIIPFAAGMLTGMVIFSRVLSWVLSHYYRQTTLVISGILIASLWLLWPFQSREYVVIDNKPKLISSSPVIPDEFGIFFMLTMALILAGFITIIIMDIVVKKMNKSNQSRA